MNFVIFNGCKLIYDLEKKRRKTISIKVTLEGRVEVSAPLNVDDSVINEIVLKRAEWILHRQNIREQVADNKCKDGGFVVYQGEDKIIRLSGHGDGNTSVELRDDEFRIYAGSNNLEEEALIKGALKLWYMSRARQVIPQRVGEYSKIMGLCPNEIRVKAQKTLWGSCSYRNNLNFNYKLLLAPSGVLDYVVVHELCHIRHRNHSSSFWKMVGEYMPDYKEKREWLKKYGHKLEVLE